MKRSLIIVAIFATLLATEVSVAQTSGRGVKIEKESCEEMALQTATNPRTSSSAVSSSEAIAFRIAMTEARVELAAQVAAEVTGFIRHRVEQYQMTAGAGTELKVNREGLHGNVTGSSNSSKTLSVILETDSAVTVQRVSQVLTNTRPVCKNTYGREDGSYQVYVCIELGLPAQREVYRSLKEEGILDIDLDGDGTNDIDLAEKEFLIELAKAREEYNLRKI